jgi:hypothetical protein
MISNKKQFFLLLVLILAIAACSGEKTASDSPTETAVAQPAAAVATAAEPVVAGEPTQQPATDTLTLEPVPTVVEAIPETEPAEPQPTAVEAEPAPTVEAKFNGRYELTYYRGSETAPVTMIDYSDFL